MIAYLLSTNYVWIFYLALCLLTGYIAPEKGRNPIAVMLLSLFLSPLVGCLFLLALPNLKQQAIEDKRHQELLEAITGNKTKKSKAINENEVEKTE